LALGMDGTMGNKGALKVAFNIGHTKICIINCHLHSG